MKQVVFIILMITTFSSYAAADAALIQQQVLRLQQETQALQHQLDELNKSLTSQEKTAKLSDALISAQKPAIQADVTKVDTVKADVAKVDVAKVDVKDVVTKDTTLKHPTKKRKKKDTTHSKSPRAPKNAVHDASVSVHSLDEHPEKLEFYPAALIADNHVVTYIAGMPVVSSPYLGARPAFDGSDYIVNISSINRDIRLMEQRRRLYRAFDRLDYPLPSLPIVTVSGKVEPIATIGSQFEGPTEGDVTLGANELDIAASLNDKVEAYMAIAYDASPPAWSGQRVANSSFNLNMGFVNIGDLDQSPFYFTAGQIFVPFGRFSSAMISPPLTMLVARTKNRPFILGYKSQKPNGPFAAIYGFSGDTTLGSSGVGGANLGYIFTIKRFAGEIGGSFISSLTNAGGMQRTGSPIGTTFGGFGSLTNGSESVRKTPGIGAHASVSFDRYNITAEWVSATESFRAQDLSFNGVGAQPQAAQLEAGVTFMLFNRPSSVAASYQWSGDSLALNLAAQRISGVYNISIWKDTVESLEYRHDIDYARDQYANGAAPLGLINQNTIGTGGAADTVLVQIGVYF